MAIIRTLDGTAYDIPDEVLQQYRVPAELAAKYLNRLHPGMRLDLSEEFGKIADAGQGPEKEDGTVR